MKRFVFLTLILMLMLTLAGCTETVYDTPEAMMAKVMERVDITDGDTLDIRYIGQCEKGDSALLWYVCDSAQNGREYYAMVCRMAEGGGYIPEAVHNTVERGEDIVFYQWGDGYVFCIANPACRTLRYTDFSGEQEVAIAEGAHPFLYRTKGLPVEYHFLDAAGNTVS